MGELFSNQYYGINIYKHDFLPIIETHSFSFFRCVEFNEDFYGKTISELHNGNLRVSRKDNRYSKLFPNQKLSYWADSPTTARCEIKKWKSSNNILTFWGYDDQSSSFPTTKVDGSLKIIDGIHFGFDRILKKVNENIELSEGEQEFIARIKLESPDCLAYHSEAINSGICFLFFEKGFKKLSLREVSLRLGDYKGKNRAKVVCADTSDYFPILENYGYSFLPIARTRFKEEYLVSDEYKKRKSINEYYKKQVREMME